MLVQDAKYPVAKQIFKLQGLHEDVWIGSVQNYVGEMLVTASGFRIDAFRQILVEFGETYNRRVAEVETDPSLLMRLPRVLTMTG